MSSLHRIRVLGRDLQVKSSAPPENVRDIEVFVNGKVAEVAASIKGSDQQLVAILALLNIVEEHLSLIREHEAARQLEAEMFSLLLKKLDASL